LQIIYNLLSSAAITTSTTITNNNNNNNNISTSNAANLNIFSTKSSQVDRHIR
jgi:hypothetical protein